MSVSAKRASLSRNKPSVSRSLVRIPGFITEKEWAMMADKSLPTIRRWARTGSGPVKTKLGKTVVYSIRSIKEFLEKATR